MASLVRFLWRAYRYIVPIVVEDTTLALEALEAGTNNRALTSPSPPPPPHPQSEELLWSTELVHRLLRRILPPTPPLLLYVPAVIFPPILQPNGVWRFEPTGAVVQHIDGEDYRVVQWGYWFYPHES